MPQETFTDSETRVSDTPSANEPEFSSETKRLSPRNARLMLAGLTLLCLLPFIGKPFNIDDPLFMWVAQQVVHHPFDPYGFKVIWYDTEMPMSAVTKNPPLASYYAALVGSWTNWSEVALHLAFLLPAVIVVLATYELARGMTKRPVLAAVLTLAAPAFLVSATSVMCDVPMLALWMLCLLAWRKGLDSENKLYLLTGAMLVALCALTKYFGACLIPLLAVYSLLRRKRILGWAPFLALPMVVLAAYQIWTKDLYGQGLLSDAAQYSQMVGTMLSPSRLGTFLVGLSFTGGCALPVLAMAPVIFRKRWIAGALGLAVVPAMLLGFNVGGKFSPGNEPRASLLITLVAFIAGGVLTIFLSARDLQKERTADSGLLFCWVLGTFSFVAVLNWTVNARSVLPLIPAAAILMARAVDRLKFGQPAWVLAALTSVPLVISLWLAGSDAALAYSARQAAREIAARHSASEGRLLFMGHWGFQYYMQELGGEPIDMRTYSIRSGDTVVRPKNNANTRRIPPEYVASEDTLEIDVNYGVTLLNINRNAGFYASVAGPLPFAFGATPPEQYTIYRLKP
jgi:4-amino-4-deoxy-L-arabinose transferase-like glycosyltransferase